MAKPWTKERRLNLIASAYYGLFSDKDFKPTGKQIENWMRRYEIRETFKQRLKKKKEMEKTTKLLIIALLFTGVMSFGQQQCAVICHNGTLVKAIGGNAIDGHLNHHESDVLISTDCDYVILGNECESLSLPKIDFTKELPIGLEYTLQDVNGKIRERGETSRDLLLTFPRGEILILQVKGYQSKIFIYEGRHN